MKMWKVFFKCFSVEVFNLFMFSWFFLRLLILFISLKRWVSVFGVLKLLFIFVKVLLISLLIFLFRVVFVVVEVLVSLVKILLFFIKCLYFFLVVSSVLFVRLRVE